MTPHSALPNFSVQRFVADLAARHHVSYQPTELDQFAQTLTELSGDRVTRDDTRDTLLALRRANILDAEMHVHLLRTHLRELRVAGLPL